MYVNLCRKINKRKGGMRIESHLARRSLLEHGTDKFREPCAAVIRKFSRPEIGSERDQEVRITQGTEVNRSPVDLTTLKF